MARRRVHRRWLTVALALALSVGLASTHASARAEEGTSGTSSTVTTVLHPGWNMVGWIGADAPVSDLFDAIPAAEWVAAWDAGAHRYVWARSGGAGGDGLRELTTGMGLWLLLRGDAPVEWEQQRADEYVLLDLRAGRNLVAWTGEDGSPFGRVARRLGSALVRASRWDAGERQLLSYSRAEPGATNSLGALTGGDALWVELAADARWWQSGTANTRFTFPDEVTAEDRAKVREDMELAIAFLAERYGIEPPLFTVSIIRNLPNASQLDNTIRVPARLFGHERYASALAHEYIHILQHHWQREHRLPYNTPRWLFEGAAVFGMLQLDDALGVWPLERTLDFWGVLPADAPPLSELEHQDAFGALKWGQALGYLAVEWLMGHEAAAAAGEHFTPFLPGWKDDLSGDAYLLYWREPKASGTWHDALESTFGIVADDFYAAFERYRRVMRARYAPDPNETYPDPSTAEGSALFEDQYVGNATRSILVDPAGNPVGLAWVVIYKREIRHVWASVMANTASEAIALTETDGTFDSSMVSEPGSWAVVTGGCRFALKHLTVRQIGPTAFELRLPAESPCDAP